MYNPDPIVPPAGTRKLRGRRMAAAAALGTATLAGAAAFAIVEVSTSGTATAATAAATTTSAPPSDPAGPWQGWANWANGPWPAAGQVKAVSSSAITATAGDGATVTIHTGPATTYSRLASAPRSAVKAGERVLVIGERSGHAALDASAVVIGPSPADPFPGDGPAGTWGPWGAAAGTVSAITGDSLSVTDAQGSTTTITLSSSTDILSALAASQRDISPGEFVLADDTGPTGVTRHVIISDQPLPLAGTDCPWTSPAAPSAS
jgi:hypothetical protein